MMEENTRMSQTPRRIQVPAPESLKDCAAFLDTYRLEALRPMFSQVRAALPYCQWTDSAPQADEQRLRQILMSRERIGKEDQVFAIAYFLSERANFALLFSSFSKPLRKVWRLVVEHYMVGHDLLLKETGEGWIEERGYFSTEMDLPDSLGFFRLQRDMNGTQYLYLPAQLRLYVVPFFIPEQGRRPHPSVLPADGPLHLFNGELEMPRLLKALEVYFMQGQLTEDMFEKMKWTAVRRLGKKLKAKEFFPDEKEKNVKDFRTFLLIESFAYCRWMADSECSFEEMVKLPMKVFLSSPAHLGYTLLPHVSGIRQSLLYSTCLDKQAQNIWLAIGQVCAGGDWVQVETLLDRLHLNESGEAYTMLFDDYAMNAISLPSAKLPTQPITPVNYYTQLAVPYVKGFLFLLAAWGMAEIAYESFDPDSPSYYDALRYFRLTSLGRYVQGMTATYEMPDTPITEFEVATNRLLIRFLEPQNAYELVLDDFADPIGGHRYRVTAASFLRSCQKPEDVKERVDFFHRYVCRNPSPVWEEFFNRLLSQSCAWEPVTAREYKIFRLPSTDQALLRLFATDPLLRKYVLKAEGYIVLVSAAHLEDVQQRLREFGYLV